MKHRIAAGLIIATLTLGLAQGVFAAPKKMTKEDIMKKQEEASKKKGSGLDSGAASTLEAQPKKMKSEKSPEVKNPVKNMKKDTPEKLGQKKKPVKKVMKKPIKTSKKKTK